jgi:hypothetical protein
MITRKNDEKKRKAHIIVPNGATMKNNKAFKERRLVCLG